MSPRQNCEVREETKVKHHYSQVVINQLSKVCQHYSVYISIHTALPLAGYSNLPRKPTRDHALHSPSHSDDGKSLCRRRECERQQRVSETAAEKELRCSRRRQRDRARCEAQTTHDREAYLQQVRQITVPCSRQVSATSSGIQHLSLAAFKNVPGYSATKSGYHCPYAPCFTCSVEDNVITSVSKS